MVKVKREICIACKQCIKDCPTQCISLVEGKAEIDNSRCIKCGHCIAICPTFAIAMDDYPMEDVIPYEHAAFHIEPDQLLHFIQYRRSIRQFKEQPVEEAKLEQIIQAGRFSPTSTNSQDVSYVVVTEKIDQMRELVLESLHQKGQYMLDHMDEQTKPYERYARMWVHMYLEHKRYPNQSDRVFFHAPSLIFVISKTPINGGLASANMELMTNALGLGCFYSGFTVRAADGNEQIRSLLGMKEGEQIISCMVIGYPAVKYQRTVPRKPAQIKWL